MRLLRTLIVLGVLIALPLGSWLYLKSGKDWRTKVLDELSERRELPADSCLISGILFDTTFFKGYSTLVARVSEGNKEVVDDLINQFGKNKKALFVLSTEEGTSIPKGVYDNMERVHFVTGAGCSRFVESVIDGGGDAALIDRYGKVRMEYQLTGEGQMEKLIRHFAVLLPLERRDKVELKRELQDDGN